MGLVLLMDLRGNLLPRGMTRAQEILVYRARLGGVSAAGGVIYGDEADCPLCHAHDAITRDGGAMEHLVKCVRRHTLRDKDKRIVINPDDFWIAPLQAAKVLGEVTKLIVATPEGAARAVRQAAIAAQGNRRRRAAN